MEMYKINERTVSETRLEARWERDDLIKMLRREYRDREKKNGSVILGLPVEHVLETYYSEGTNVMDRNDRWKSWLRDQLLEMVQEGGFSPNSTIENVSRSVRIDRIRGEYIAKIELFPIRKAYAR